jgi:probable HAF family extracellular repeat protein
MKSPTSARFVASLASVLALAPLAFAQKNPAPIDLGTLGGTFSQASGIGGKDNVVGAANLAGDLVTHAFISSPVPGTGPVLRKDLGSFIGPDGNSAAVSLSGAAIAGTSDANIGTDPDGNPITSTHSFYLPTATSTMQDIGTLGGDTTIAVYMRNGCVVGSSFLTDDTATHGFIWCAPTDSAVPGGVSITDLPPLNGGTTSYATGVNFNGTVAVGNSDASDGSTHAVQWRNAVIKDLGTLGGSYTGATAINAYGVVAGFGSLLGDAQVDAFIGFAGILIDFGSLGGSYAQANAISDSGIIVGSSNTTGDLDSHAFIWTPRTGMVDLNSMLPSGSPWDLLSANAIGADGTIVGIGIINGEAHAFAW